MRNKNLKRRYIRPSVTVCRMEAARMIAVSREPGAGIMPPGVDDYDSQVEEGGSGNINTNSKHYDAWD